MSRDHVPRTVIEFNGLFDRGEDETTPPNHFSVAKNIVFSQRGFQTRFGSSQSVILSNSKRIHTYKRSGETSRLLILKMTGPGGIIGSIYDSLNLVSPILSIEGMTDFSCHVFFNRAYITPHNGETGLAGEKVYVYDGTTLRPAAGSKPTGTLIAANSITSGSVEAGTHLFAVAFETASGYVTKPGPELFAVLLATGGKKVDLSSIPTGPAGTVARIFLATKFIQTYDGNQIGYEFFFIPGARLADNVSLTYTVDFFDANLLQSADYLFDQLEVIPAGVGIGSYKSRLTTWGSNSDPSLIRLSKAGDPESHDSIEGFILVNPNESDGISNTVEFRDNFYMTKSLGTSMISEVLGQEPAFWGQPISVDEGIGSEPFGIGTILNKKGTNVDSFVAASRTGLMLFNGLYIQRPLSWKIEAIWNRINKNAFNKIQVAMDSKSQLIYVGIPLDSATEISHILLADYRNGLDADSIRWSIWEFAVSPASLLIDIENASQRPFLRVSNANGVDDISTTIYNDNGVAINTLVRFAPLSMDESGAVIHVGAIRLMCRGFGGLQIRLLGLDDSNPETLATIPLAPTPGVEKERPSNFINEKCAVELKTEFFNEQMNITKMTLFMRPIWASRPIE